MSKILLFLITAGLFLAGCEAPEPQVTVTSTKVAATQVTTLTQIPSETIEPSTTPTQEPTPTIEYESIWDPDRIRWVKLTEGSYNGVTCQLSIEIDFSIYERSVNAWVGFEEAGGTFQDVGNTCAATISMLPETGNGNRSVEVNMDLKRDGSYEPVGFNGRSRDRNKRVEFNPQVPIRFVYFDGNEGSNGHVFPLDTFYYSQGWGVDPETQGLVYFMGVPSTTVDETLKGRIYGTYIVGSLAELAGVGWGNTILDQEKWDTLYNLWYGVDPTLIVGVFTTE